MNDECRTVNPAVIIPRSSFIVVNCFAIRTLLFVIKVLMPSLHLSLTSPVADSFRVHQIAGMFDVPLTDRAQEHMTLDIPPLDDFDWRVGLIIGPSASGKTTIARHLFGDAYHEPAPWPRDRAVVDGFDDLTIHQITRLFTAVGFSSPPAWIKPYHCLSTGQRFRCDLARALAGNIAQRRTSQVPDLLNRVPWTADDGQCVVIDEFTSVIDRISARFASSALARALRSGVIPGKFVAVTCHDDIAPWLSPDWTIDMGTERFTKNRPARPPLKLALHHCSRALWPRFSRHHYLAGSLAPTARCFTALYNREPVAFCATLPLIGRRHHWRITRLVVLPDYQGAGIGMRVAEAVAELHRAEGRRMNISASHPAVVAHCRCSPRWRLVQLRRTGSRPSKKYHNYNGSIARPLASFEYEPTPSRSPCRT
jgi:GNAT superfamily N-acetyltransferase